MIQSFLIQVVSLSPYHRQGKSLVRKMEGCKGNNTVLSMILMIL